MIFFVGFLERCARGLLRKGSAVMVRYWFLALVLTVFAGLFPMVVRASVNASYDAAMSACQAYHSGPDWAAIKNSPANAGHINSDHCAAGVTSQGNCGASLVCVVWSWDSTGGYATNSYYFSGAIPPPPPTCTANQSVPAGTAVDRYQAAGETCYQGCSVAMNVDISPSGAFGASNGTYSLTGSACAVSTGAVSQPKVVPPVQSETVNADGSKTYCDPISGTCVTSGGPAPVAPASSSSSANNSTDTTAQTSTPASSSSSTTTTTGTTTTSGSGTSGSGTTGTIDSVATTKTDNPASASSTSSKCTTGACDVGNADGNIGSLYTAGTDTPASVYAAFRSSVSSSPLISAATGFFTVQSSGAACPTWHIPGNKYWGASGFDFTFFCDPAMLAIFAACGWIVLAVGAFSAFRIALY